MNIGIVLSGGVGSRLGSDIPKQYIKVNGKKIIQYCLETFCKSRTIDKIIVVAMGNWQQEIKDIFDEIENGNEKFIGFSKPGETRQLSIYSALLDIETYCSKQTDTQTDKKPVNILIHDAARPLVTEELISQCFEQLDQYEGVLPAIKVKDTMYMTGEENGSLQMLDRNRIVAGQAPEAFRFKEYFLANNALFPSKIYEINGSTEPAIISGMKITTITGDEDNFKITTSSDLNRFKKIIEEKLDVADKQ